MPQKAASLTQEAAAYMAQEGAYMAYRSHRRRAIVAAARFPPAPRMPLNPLNPRMPLMHLKLVAHLMHLMHLMPLNLAAHQAAQRLPSQSERPPDSLHYRLLTLCPRGLLTLWARAGMCVCKNVCMCTRALQGGGRGEEGGGRREEGRGRSACASVRPHACCVRAQCAGAS